MYNMSFIFLSDTAVVDNYSTYFEYRWARNKNITACTSYISGLFNPTVFFIPGLFHGCTATENPLYASDKTCCAAIAVHESLCCNNPITISGTRSMCDTYEQIPVAMLSLDYSVSDRTYRVADLTRTTLKKNRTTLKKCGKNSLPEKARLRAHLNATRGQEFTVWSCICPASVLNCTGMHAVLLQMWL